MYLTSNQIQPTFLAAVKPQARVVYHELGLNHSHFKKKGSFAIMLFDSADDFLITLVALTRFKGQKEKN